MTSKGCDSVSDHQPHDCFSNFYSDADQRKHQSSASLAFVRGFHRGPVNSPHKWPVTRKMFPFDDVIMFPHLTFRIPLHVWCGLHGVAYAVDIDVMASVLPLLIKFALALGVLASPPPCNPITATTSPQTVSTPHPYHVYVPSIDSNMFKVCKRKYTMRFSCANVWSMNCDFRNTLQNNTLLQFANILCTVRWLQC